ncbi:MAG: hypothetical protein JNK72_06135 [Myxococcales bacterium]|nr:hypothetical protein [Myxococcales bacterium]
MRLAWLALCLVPSTLWAWPDCPPGRVAVIFRRGSGTPMDRSPPTITRSCQPQRRIEAMRRGGGSNRCTLRRGIYHCIALVP